MRIIVVGASIGALAAARRLRELLPTADVTLVSDVPSFIHRRHIPHLLSRHHHDEHVRIGLAHVCDQLGVRFHLGPYGALDTAARVLTLGEQRLHYEAIILDLPDAPSNAHEPGAENAHMLGSEASAEAIRTHVIEQVRRARANTAPELRTVVVIGSGRDGIEAATELAALIREASREHHIFPEEITQLILRTERDGSEGTPRAVAARLARLLAARGIEFRTPTYIRHDSGRVTVDGKLYPAGTVVWTSHRHGHPLLAASGLSVDEYGYALVDHALRTSDDRVIAIGSSIRSIGDTPLPEPRRARDFLLEGRAAAQTIAAIGMNRHVQPVRFKITPSRTVTLGARTALSWLGPFSVHGSLPYTLHHHAERKAVLATHKH